MTATRRDLVTGMGLLAFGVKTQAANGAPLAGSRAHTQPSISHLLIWDDHSGFDPRPNYDLEHLKEWRDACVEYLSINVGEDYLEREWQIVIRNLSSYIAWFEKRSDRFVLVRQADDVLRAKTSGKMAIAFDLEGM